MEKSNSKAGKFQTLVVFILLIFATWSFYSYLEVKEELRLTSTVEGLEELRKQNVTELLEQVGSHMILPEDVEPTVATITDVEALVAEQPFFEGAEDGDKLLVYVGTQKAIIYSPARDIIVNVGSVAVNNENVDVDRVE